MAGRSDYVGASFHCLWRFSTQALQICSLKREQPSNGVCTEPLALLAAMRAQGPGNLLPGTKKSR